MQFSLKWLMAAVAYAAICGASVTYAADGWIDALLIGRYFALAMTAVAAGVATGGRRLFLTGFAAVGLLFEVGVSPLAGEPSPLRSTLERRAESVALLIPSPDQSVLAQKYLEAEYAPWTIQKVRRITPAGKSGEVSVLAVRTDENGAMLPFRLDIPASVVSQAPSRENRAAVLVEHFLIMFALAGGICGGLIYAWSEREQNRRRAPRKEA